jgi:2-iminobutanoate/2-iminopropanoate deaminase
MFRTLLVLLSFFVSAKSYSNQPQDYSNAVTAGDFLYVSGQFPIDPVTGKMAHGSMEDLTNLTLDYIEHILHVKGFKMNQVVKTEVFLVDMRDFDQMDAAYASRFNSQHPPARDVTQSAKLQNNARVEISCVAYKNR